MKDFMDLVLDNALNPTIDYSCAANCADLLSVVQPKQIVVGEDSLGEARGILTEEYVDYIGLKAANVSFTVFNSNNPQNMARTFFFDASSWAKPPKVFGSGFKGGHSFHLATFDKQFDVHIVFDKSTHGRCEHYDEEDHVPPTLVKKIQYVILKALSALDLTQSHFLFDSENLMNSPYLKEKMKHWVPLSKLRELNLNFQLLQDPFFRNHTARLYISAIGQNAVLPETLFGYFEDFFHLQEFFEIETSIACNIWAVDEMGQKQNLILTEESLDRIFGLDTSDLEIYTKAFNNAFCNFQTKNRRRIPESLLTAMHGVDREGVSVEIIGLLGYSAVANLTRPNKWQEPFAKYPITKFFEKDYVQKDRFLIQEDFNRIKNAVAGYSAHGVSYRVEVTLHYKLSNELGSNELSEAISSSLNTSLNNIREYCLEKITPSLNSVPKEIFPGVLQTYSQFFAVIIEMLASLHYSNSLSVFQIEFASMIERLLMFLLNGNLRHLSHPTFSTLEIKESIVRYNFPFIKTDFINVENLSLQDAYGLPIFLDYTSSIQEIRLGREGGQSIQKLSLFEKDIQISSDRLKRALESTDEQLMTRAIEQAHRVLNSFIELLITQMSEWYSAKVKDRTSRVTGNSILTNNVTSYLLYRTGADFFSNTNELLELNAFSTTQTKIEVMKIYEEYMEKNIMAGWNLPEWFYAHRVRSLVLQRIFVFLPFEAKLSFQIRFLRCFVQLKYFPLFGKTSSWITYGKYCEISPNSLYHLENPQNVANLCASNKRQRTTVSRDSPLMNIDNEEQERPRTIQLPGNQSDSHFGERELEQYYKITNQASFILPFESAIRNEKKRLLKCVELPTHINYRVNANLPKHYLYTIYTSVIMSHLQPLLSGDRNGSIKVFLNEKKVSKNNYATTLYSMILKEAELIRKLDQESEDRFKKRYQNCHLNKLHIMVVFRTNRHIKHTVSKLNENFDELEMATRQGNLNLLEFFHLQ